MAVRETVVIGASAGGFQAILQLARQMPTSYAGHFGLELVESIGRLDLGSHTTDENQPDGGACVRVIFPMPAMQGALAS